MGNYPHLKSIIAALLPVAMILAGAPGGIARTTAAGKVPAQHRNVHKHPAPEPPAEPVDTIDNSTSEPSLSLMDSTEVTAFQMPFNTIVDEVPEVDPVAWADTAIFHHSARNPHERLSQADYVDIARELGVETAAIKAVVEIEAGPQHKGFWKPGKPIINFDLTMFRQFAARRGISVSGAQKSHPVIFRGPDRKKYGSQQGGQYARLEAAGEINRALGIESCFWGMFQIGGFAWRKCGCNSIEEFVELMSRSERDQLELFARFVESYNLAGYIRSHNWLGFALKYNGPKAKQRGYHTRMANAYRKHKALEAKTKKTDK